MISSNNTLREAINRAYRMDETECIDILINAAQLSESAKNTIQERTRTLVTKIRTEGTTRGLDNFLVKYSLSSQEGVALMCLAEALLRIPDSDTVDKLIRDKVGSADWSQHADSDSVFVNAATWGLMLTGRVVSPEKNNSQFFERILKKLIARMGEPVIRQVLKKAMQILGKQFVMGETIESALRRSEKLEQQGYTYSYDMLGEAARTMAEADRYFEAYTNAIQKIGKASVGRGVFDGPGISVKLSGLHPRYEFAKRERILIELTPKVLALCEQAKAMNIGITIDAEESERLDISLDIISAVFTHPHLSGWEGLGLAVQAYQKRAYYVIDYLAELARSAEKRLIVRLVKGAYWDSEIKRSQENGYNDYPVFTRKAATDVSYIACAKKLLAMQDLFYCQFATHNAYTLATILEIAGDKRDFEFQRLHGMGEALYEQMVGKHTLDRACRIYAPVGGHEYLLAYLVRRLLENGANTSFVHRLNDLKAPIEELWTDPVAAMAACSHKPHPRIPVPAHLFGTRINSAGVDLSNRNIESALMTELQALKNQTWMAAPLIGGELQTQGERLLIRDPANREQIIGQVIEANAIHVHEALAKTRTAVPAWQGLSIDERASCLERMADLLEKHRAELIWLAVREAGKTIPNAIGEVREAVDFCRYYAERARLDLSPIDLPGPTGETNQLITHGRGIIVCISPWNFPLAIFTGQIAAALVAGNAVIAKPAEQTPLIATFAVRLWHEAGIPVNVIQCLPGKGEVIGSQLVTDNRVAGVMFTGSTDTARAISQALASRPGPIVPLIAETGGQNAMIVDSSALLEQVVVDVLSSAFDSAGQRCSALRVLLIQEDVADKFIELLQGAMRELSVGDPMLLTTDVGPVIDEDAKAALDTHIANMHNSATLLAQTAVSQHVAAGCFVAPVAFELKDLKVLTHEVFGPILHVIRYAANELDKVIDMVNDTGYGLTFGIHSRIDETVNYIKSRVHAGNIYVNRNMIGAVVGVQPFGGEGLSGTGPKAGGPHYLQRLVVERVVTINTAALGGNAALLALE